MKSLSLASTLWRLSRAHMTTFSAVTYLASAVLAAFVDGRDHLDAGYLFGGYVFTISCQMCAHFIGEYYDLDADKHNRFGSRLTGGSRVLIEQHDDDGDDNESNRKAKMAFVIGNAFACLSIAVLMALPERVFVIGLLMVLLAHQYSAPPLRLNHCGFGEITAAFIMNILLPMFAAALQITSSLSSDLVVVLTWKPELAWSLAFLIIPGAFLKFAAFLVLNLNDRRPDWQGHKNTLAVLLDEKVIAVLHSASIAAAYISAAIIFTIAPSFSYTSTGVHWTCVAGMFASMPLGMQISDRLLSSTLYRFDELVALSLRQCTLVIWAVLYDQIITKTIHTRQVLTLANSLALLLSIIAFTSMKSAAKASLSQGSDSLSLLHQRHEKVIICGGGVAGLTLAACLHRLNVPFVVLEKRPQGHCDDGADLGVWPSAKKILTELGISELFWKQNSFPVRTVHMRKMNYDNGFKKHILQRIDMDQVVDGTGDHFSLVARRPLMLELAKLIPEKCIRYGVKVSQVIEAKNGVEVFLHDSHANASLTSECGRLVIGADGASSTIRRHMFPTEEPPRYCGEACYRGIVHLNENSPAAIAICSLLDDNAASSSQMNIDYGYGLRSSVGLIDSTGNMAYWWVKHKQSTFVDGRLENCPWPEPLRTLHEYTVDKDFYLHPIRDRMSSKRWSNPECTQVLIGDAAHMVTPNMGQGACMAIEDAFVLGVFMAEMNGKPDGIVEAAFMYERVRRPHVEAVANESFNQSKIGQWTHPVMVWLREFILSSLPASFFQNKLRRVNLFRVEEYVQRYHHMVSKAGEKASREKSDHMDDHKMEG